MQFVKEGHTFTGEDNPIAQLMLNLMGLFAEFERSIIKEQQREGIAAQARKKPLSQENTKLREKQYTNLKVGLYILITIKYRKCAISNLKKVFVYAGLGFGY